jgi:hypothetical protein
MLSKLLSFFIGGRLTLWRSARRAYIASERLLIPDRDSLFFPVARARGAHIVPEAGLSCSSRPFSPRPTRTCTSDVE